MVNKYLDKKMSVPQIAEEMFSTENFVKNKNQEIPATRLIVRVTVFKNLARKGLHFLESLPFI